MRLPDSVQELAGVIGRERALFLIGQLPRCYSRKSCHIILYIPKTISRDHQLAKILKWNEAVNLVRAFGGEIMQPANCAGIYKTFRDRSALTMLETGLKPVEIAEILGVSDRHVRNLRRENPSIH
ncbi:hypothetical protein [Pseudomonas fluorescens]